MKFRLIENTSNDFIILYHNTPYVNVDSILKSGLLISKSHSEKASGYQFTWATTHPLKDDSYGGCIVKFRLPKDYSYEQVNNDQYVIHQDIEPNLIDSVDIMIGDGGTGYMHQSDVQDYVDEYGKDMVKKVILKYHNRQISSEDVKRLTPELDWRADT